MNITYNIVYIYIYIYIDIYITYMNKSAHGMNRGSVIESVLLENIRKESEAILIHLEEDETRAFLDL